HTTSVAHADSRLAYGFVAGPGTFETTVTRPELFARYYQEQFRLLLKNHGGRQDVRLEVGVSAQPIPVHFCFAADDHIEGNLSPAQRLLLRDLFDLPDLGAMDDGIANGTLDLEPGQAQPLSFFTAPRVDYSLQRLRHYTGTDPEHFQNFVIFTNYQFYADAFARMCRERIARGEPGCDAFVEPGNVITPSARFAAAATSAGTAPARAPQMPAWQLVGPDHDGITMINIGNGPSNARNITDHVAVMRPHAWLMLGHCAGLRSSQQIGDY